MVVVFVEGVDATCVIFVVAGVVGITVEATAVGGLDVDGGVVVVVVGGVDVLGVLVVIGGFVGMVVVVDCVVSFVVDATVVALQISVVLPAFSQHTDSLHSCLYQSYPLEHRLTLGHHEQSKSISLDTQWSQLVARLHVGKG